jgi:hypothetical protein
MLDTIKTPQRALEHITEQDVDGVEGPPGRWVVTMSGGYSSERRRDTLGREFFESGLFVYEE